MDWKERALAMAEARSSVHDSYKIPAMYSPDNGVSWRVVFCRLHELVNPDGVRLGRGQAEITVSSSNPEAIFRKTEVADINSTSTLVIFSASKAYKVTKAAPADLYGYLTASLSPAPKNVDSPYPVPDWEVL